MEQILDTVALTTAEIPSLEQQIEAVRDLRARLATEKGILDISRENWYFDNNAQIAFVEQIKHELELSESALRESVVQVFEHTGNKKPAQGVGIKMIQQVDYYKPQAFGWAKEHQTCLQLDAKAFEALAKASSGHDMPCKVNAVPQATISREL